MTHFKAYQRLLSQLLPSVCVLCGTKIQHSWDMCFSCYKELPRLDKVCAVCSLPLRGDATTEIQCGACQQKAPAFNKTIAAFLYESPIDFLLTGLKFKQKLTYAKLMGYLLAHRIRQAYQTDILPKAIVPIPLHTQRLRERGFNQAVEIAKPLSRYLKLPLLRNLCQRSRTTLAQSELTAAERYKNMQGAFQVKAALTIPHIAIVDDIMTTGATVNELAQILRKQGVQRIDVWCCARVDTHC